MLRKERRKNPVSKSLYKEEYPEHLRHLYMAEAEKLKNEAWTHRMNRSKLRMKGKERGEEGGEGDDDDDDDGAAASLQSEAADPDPEVTGSVTENPEVTSATEKER